MTYFTATEARFSKRRLQTHNVVGQPKIWLKMKKIGPRGACVQNLSLYGVGSSFTFEEHFLSEFYERKNMEFYYFFLYQLKCKKQLNENNSVFEIDLMQGSYTPGWQLCGLRMFEGGNFKTISFINNLLHAIDEFYSICLGFVQN